MDIKKLERQIKEDKKDKFELYYNLLREANKRFNITSITEKNDVFCKHFLDSTAGEEFFTLNCEALEVGSGGGFPSIPLKILREDINFTLVESTGKKCNFLTEVVDKLGFDGVKVVNARAEELARDSLYREKYDAVCARAVARLNVLCEYCLPFVKKGGVFVAYKGESGDEVKEAIKAIKVLGGEIEQVVNYDLPGEAGKRSLIVIKKVESTPVKYPRGRGMERKKPIV